MGKGGGGLNTGWTGGGGGLRHIVHKPPDGHEVKRTTDADGQRVRTKVGPNTKVRGRLTGQGDMDAPRQ